MFSAASFSSFAESDGGSEVFNHSDSLYACRRRCLALLATLGLRFLQGGKATGLKICRSGDGLMLGCGEVLCKVAKQGREWVVAGWVDFSGALDGG
jgi:hypothetical protein